MLLWLDSFQRLGQKYRDIFVHFLVQRKTSEYAFEINWPIVVVPPFFIGNRYSLTFLHVSKPQYFFSNLNYNCFNSLDIRNLQEQVKKAFFYHKLFWTLKIFANSLPLAANFKSFSQSLEQNTKLVNCIHIRIIKFKAKMLLGV